MPSLAISDADRLRQAIAEIITINAHDLNAVIGQLVVATAADCPAAGLDSRSLHDAATRTTVLLADRIPAGQEAQALAAEIAQWHGRDAAREVMGQAAEGLLGPVKVSVEFKVVEPDPGRSLRAVFVPKGEPLSGGLFGNAETDMVEFSDLRDGVCRAVKYLDAAAVAGIRNGHCYSAFYGATISRDDSQTLAAWVAERSGKALDDKGQVWGAMPSQQEVSNHIAQQPGGALVNKRLLDALRLAVRPLIRLGDFVGNVDKGGASGLGEFDRCAIVQEVRSAIAEAEKLGEEVALVRVVPDADLLAEINRRGMLQPLYGAIGAMHDHLDRTGALDERLTQYLAYRLRREEAAITGMPDSAARVANWQECINQLDREARGEDGPSM